MTDDVVFSLARSHIIVLIDFFLRRAMSNKINEPLHSLPPLPPIKKKWKQLPLNCKNEYFILYKWLFCVWMLIDCVLEWSVWAEEILP